MGNNLENQASILYDYAPQHYSFSTLSYIPSLLKNQQPVYRSLVFMQEGIGIPGYILHSNSYHFTALHISLSQSIPYRQPKIRHR